MKKKKIWSLEILRCLAFIAVVVSHAGYKSLNKFGGWAVSIFFILSGFLLVYNYADSGRIRKVSLTENFGFMVRKISKLHLLHVACTLAIIPFCFIGSDSESTVFVLFKLMTNLLMIQEWFPFVDNSINGVSWFLCSICFGYFMFPWFLKKLEERKEDTAGVIRNIVVLFIMQVILSFVINLMFGNAHPEGIFVSNPAYWLIYNFPLMRFIEIVMGFYLGYYFLYSKKELSKKLCSALEIVIICGAVCTGLFLNWYCKAVDEGSLWWAYTLIYSLQALFAVYVFAFGKGSVSNMLNKKPVMFMADISSNGFLIHYVVFDYLTTAVYLLLGREFEKAYAPLINLTLGVEITVVACAVWKFLLNLFNRRKLKV